MIIAMVTVRVVQVAVDEVVDVVIVRDGFVAAIGAVFMVVTFVDVAHFVSFQSGVWGSRQDDSFGGMSNGIGDEFLHVPVREGIKDMFSLPAIRHDPLASQQFQPLRDRRHVVIEQLRDFRDTPLASHQQAENLQSR